MRILLIEDDMNLCDTLSFQLTREGHEVELCHDGRDGLDLFIQDAYDLILLDRMLPTMNGLLVLKKARNAGVHTPVIMITALGELYDRIEGLDTGADDYLTKPFAAKELLARIRAMTREHTSAVNASLHTGNLTLDLASYTLSSPTGNFRLTNKEFQMLEMLMANPGQLIPSERFLERIWGYDSEAETNVVWVYISYLRKKLTALHANVQLKAARNAGYFLEVLP